MHRGSQNTKISFFFISGSVHYISLWNTVVVQFSYTFIVMYLIHSLNLCGLSPTVGDPNTLSLSLHTAIRAFLKVELWTLDFFLHGRDVSFHDLTFRQRHLDNWESSQNYESCIFAASLPISQKNRSSLVAVVLGKSNRSQDCCSTLTK